MVGKLNLYSPYRVSSNYLSHICGLEVQSTMKMVGTYLAEVTGESDGKIKRRDEGRLVCIGFLGIAALHTTNKEQKREKYRIFHILYSQYYFKCMQI